MKKVAVLLAFFGVFMVGCVSYTPMNMTINKDEEVYQVKGTKDEIFANVMKFASTQRMRVDSSKVIADSATGIIAFSTGSFITNPNFGGWQIFASYSVSVECKNGKIRVTVRNPMYEYSNAANSQPLQSLPYASGSDVEAKKNVALYNDELNKCVAKTKKDLVESLNKSVSF